MIKKIILLCLLLLACLCTVNAYNFYQEAANQTYFEGNFSSDYPSYNSNDSNWKTASRVNNSMGVSVLNEAIIYVNYTKLERVNNRTTFIVSDSGSFGDTANYSLTIFQDCMDAYSTDLVYKTRLRTWPIDGDNSIRHFCYNGTAWRSLLYINPQYYFYEDAINWSIGNVVDLISPIDMSIHTNNISFSCSIYSYDNKNRLENTTFYVWNSTNSIVFQNTTNTTGAFNTTTFEYNFTYEDTYHWNCLVYENESIGDWSDKNYTFSLVINSPAVNLNYPLDNKFFNSGLNIYFNFTATDFLSLDTCKLYTNNSGSWGVNYTWVSPTNGVMNYTTLNLSEGSYIWNVECNNSANKFGSYNFNYTLNIDTTFPIVTIHDINTTPNTNLIFFNSSVNESHSNNCFYSIFNSSDGIDGLLSNISISCDNTASSSTSVSTYGTFNLFIYANDSAGNLNYTNKTFTTTQSTTDSGGGGGSTPPATSEVISLIQPINLYLSASLNLTTQNNLSRAIIYAEIRRSCLDKNPCILNSDQKNDLIILLDSLDIILNLEELNTWIDSYNKNYLEVIKLEDSQINQYNLFTGILQIDKGNLIANPSRLDPFPPYFIFSSDKPVFRTKIKFNKVINDSYILEGGDSSLSVNWTTTEATIILNITDSNWASKVFTGTASFTSLEGDVTFVPINLRVINVRNGFTIITGVIFIGVIVLITVFGKSISKTFKLKKLSKNINKKLKIS